MKVECEEEQPLASSLQPPSALEIVMAGNVAAGVLAEALEFAALTLRDQMRRNSGQAESQCEVLEGQRDIHL